VSYELIFPSECVEREVQKALRKVQPEYQAAIIEAGRSLASNPRPGGKNVKQVKGQTVLFHLIAQYRLRIGPYRILYDIDEKKKKIILLKLLKRDEHTYK
jgi:mRNA interferase RelE/StbE